ncbi:YfcE family phosphodiesterase [bacterium]|nr:YfcE family phosphodiesterase [bacterium]
MRITIISDTHDNIVNFKKAIGWIKRENIKTIIHCGDISLPGTLKEALQDFKGKIHLVFGNMDDKRLFEKEEIKNAIFYGQVGEIEEDNKKIAFCHFPDKAKELALTGKYDLVFYGHTHKPWEQRINHCRLVNPGNLAGILYKATFAVYETQNDILELKILDEIR